MFQCPWCDQIYEISTVGEGVFFDCEECHKTVLVTRRQDALEQEEPEQIELIQLNTEEQKVLELLAEGHSSIEIADVLISSGFATQDQFSTRLQTSILIQELLKKFRVSDQAELIKKARQEKHLPPE